IMGRDRMEEVLQWMHLAMGTDAEKVVAGDSIKSISSVLEKLRQLKSDLELTRSEANRYKKELEESSSMLKAEMKRKEEKIHQLEKELEVSKEENERLKMQLGSTNSHLKTELKVKEDADVEKTVDPSTEKLGESGTQMATFPMSETTLGSSTKVFSGEINARFTNISNVCKTDGSVRSDSVNVGGVEWRIMIGRCVRGGKEYLGVFLEMISNIPETWSCSVFDEVHILNHEGKEWKRTRTNESAAIYDNKTVDWGYDDVISLNDLFDSRNAYVKSDSILVSVHFVVFPSY
ncbi:hypothetical protein PFISCL1PPCAC_20287, partial [Pristionchus fissidentatus]